MSEKKSAEQNATNTKCCNNCYREGDCKQELLKVNKLSCRVWQRSPRMWLDIAPVKPGWYWHNDGKSEPYTIWIERDSANGNLVTCIDDWVKIETLGGQWQGPIEPAK